MANTYLKIKYKSTEELVPTKATFNKISNIYTENGITIGSKEIIGFNPSPTFYGNVVGTCDNALMLDDLMANEVYSIRNKPTKADVGLDKVTNQYMYGYADTASTGLGYLQINNYRMVTQRFILNNRTNTMTITSIGNGLYVGEVDVNWVFNWSFIEVPFIQLTPIGISYRMINVKPGYYDKDKISKVQVYTVTNDTSLINDTVSCLLCGKV